MEMLRCGGTRYSYSCRYIARFASRGISHITLSNSLHCLLNPTKVIWAHDDEIGGVYATTRNKIWHSVRGSIKVWTILCINCTNHYAGESTPYRSSLPSCTFHLPISLFAELFCTLLELLSLNALSISLQPPRVTPSLRHSVAVYSGGAHTHLIHIRTM